MQFLTYKGYLVMGHGILKVFYKSLVSLLQVSYKSLKSLLQVSYIQGSLVIGCGSWGMVHGSWGRGHGIRVMGRGHGIRVIGYGSWGKGHGSFVDLA